MYHLQLRQFPHNLCRFNLSEQELAVIVQPWAYEQWVELGERKWSPHQAKLTVLEGPSLPLAQLSMGRGWRNAERNGEDVTERLLAAARQPQQPGGQPSVMQPPPAQQPAPSQSVAQSSVMQQAERQSLLADSLGLELLAALASEPLPLLRVWELADARSPGGSASASLALAEQTVSSLLRSQLIVLDVGDPREADLRDGPQLPQQDADAAGPLGAEGSGEQPVEPQVALLAARASWVGDLPAERVWMHRS